MIINFNNFYNALNNFANSPISLIKDTNFKYKLLFKFKFKNFCFIIFTNYPSYLN